MSSIGGINLGNLTDYLFFFANGSADADWKDAKHGYLGDVGVNGIKADEHTNANVPYAGTIYTNDTTLGDWQDIVNNNPGQAFESLNQVARIAGLESDLISAFQQINALPVSSGFTSRDAASLDGLNTQNGINELFVINVTSGFDVAAPINITGDAGDVFVLLWDEDADPANGYQGRVRFRHGGAIVPHGGLTPANFIHVAGQIDSAGGGSTPPAPYPQGPRYNNGTGALINGGSDWTAGGFFTGYWLTTGEPSIYDPATGLYYGATSSLSDATFVGGWYTLTTQFVLTAQSGGVYVAPNLTPAPAILVKKYVSPDGGATWEDAQTAPGPNIPSTVDPQFKFVVTNTGNVPLSLVSLTDSVYGVISVGGNLDVGSSFESVITKPWSEGPHENEATATGTYGRETVSSYDLAHYVGIQAGTPAIQLIKYVSPDGGASWLEANTPPGPVILSDVAPQFQFVVTNTGDVELTNVIVTDDNFGFIGGPVTLPIGQSASFFFTATWEEGQHVNTATATACPSVQDQSTAYYYGVWVTPAIAVKKYVSADNGVTWEDANTPPGPSIPPSIDPQFRFVVTNTGNVGLENIAVVDDVLGFVAAWPTLAAGNSVEQILSGTWQEGLHENTATATVFTFMGPLAAQDNAFYTGVVDPPNPSVDIVKYVSVDDGTTWVHAPTSPGPLLPQGMTAQFQYVVTNTGNMPLTNVTITDSVLGQIATGISLDVGESVTFYA